MYYLHEVMRDDSEGMFWTEYRLCRSSMQPEYLGSKMSWDREDVIGDNGEFKASFLKELSIFLNNTNCFIFVDSAEKQKKFFLVGDPIRCEPSGP